MQDFRSQFDVFKKSKVVYLDSAATTQKPAQVLQVIQDYLGFVANPGRNPFGKSQQLANQIEQARAEIASFFNAQSQNLAFTGGVTSAMNTLSQSLMDYLTQEEAEILICKQDHKSTILPWIELAAQYPNIKITYYNLSPFTGEIDEQDLQKQLTAKTKLVVLTHAHNIYGIVNDIQAITANLPSQVLTILDSAQTVSHLPVDFQTLGVDCMLFSGHKMFALEATGGMLASSKAQAHLTQVTFGGGLEDPIFPYIFEIGTPNTAGILSMQAAINLLKSNGMHNIHQQVMSLTKYCLQALSSLPGIEFESGTAYNQKSNNTGIIAFRLSADQDELSSLLEQQNINIRVGTHCSSDNKAQDTIRISLHAYNNQNDIDRLVTTLSHAVN